MQRNVLGNSGIEVSRMCFGSLTMGPLQANLHVSAGADLLLKAFEQGVNFIDPAEYYKNYGYIKEALSRWEGEPIVIASKSYAYSREDMEKSLADALKGIGRDYIDIFLLHEQESSLTIQGHWDAVEVLLEAKRKGQVRAIGVSTHCIEGVRAAAMIPEFDIIHPLLNMKGIGIEDGMADEMLEAIEFAAEMGKGIYAMKPLGGGHLMRQAEKAIRFDLEAPGVAAVAVGMQSEEELTMNLAIFNEQPVSEEIKEKLSQKERKLIIGEECSGCCSCMLVCRHGALRREKGKVIVDQEKCCLCGYCGAACPNFCIKVI